MYELIIRARIWWRQFTCMHNYEPKPDIFGDVSFGHCGRTYYRYKCTKCGKTKLLDICENEQYQFYKKHYENEHYNKN